MENIPYVFILTLHYHMDALMHQSSTASQQQTITTILSDNRQSYITKQFSNAGRGHHSAMPKRVHAIAHPEPRSGESKQGQDDNEQSELSACKQTKHITSVYYYKLSDSVTSEAERQTTNHNLVIKFILSECFLPNVTDPTQITK